MFEIKSQHKRSKSRSDVRVSLPLLNNFGLYEGRGCKSRVLSLLFYGTQFFSFQVLSFPNSVLPPRLQPQPVPAGCASVGLPSVPRPRAGGKEVWRQGHRASSVFLRLSGSPRWKQHRNPRPEIRPDPGLRFLGELRSFTA